MARARLSRKEKAYRSFFEKTGIQITEEPVEEYQPGLDDELEELYYKCRITPRKSIPKLEKLKQQYPHIPSIKNFLFAAYTLSKQKKKAKQILEETLEKHPKYVFGITNKILNISDEEELKKYEHLLGNPKDIRELEGYDKPIHISAFKNYQAVVAHFEAVSGNQDAAVERLQTLIDVRVEKEFLESVASNIGRYRFLNMGKNLKKMNEGRISSKHDQTVFLEPSETPPKLSHPELEIFYQKSISNFSEEDLKTIEALPKATLIDDVENILEDSIRRWEEFRMEDFNESKHEFILHALYWLGDLRSKNSLNKVLNLLRMEREFIDYWMADRYEEFFFPTLYYLGESQLNELKDFILENNIYCFYRLRASEVAAQVAIHQPHRREEVVQWYQDIFNHLLENPDNEFLIDTDFIGFLINDAIDFRGVELWETIEALNKKGWIHESIQGDVEKIKRLINESFHESELKPLPLNIREFYSKEYKKRRIPDPPPSDEDQKIMDELMNPSEAQLMVLNNFTNVFSSAISKKEKTDSSYPDRLPFPEEKSDYGAVKTIVRNEKKVGRNDPCPCGSGKKYKKCCLKK